MRRPSISRFAVFSLALTSAAAAADKQAPASSLPGFAASELPQFVAVTFDDNFQVDGMDWAVAAFSALQNPTGNAIDNNYDGEPVRTTFFFNSLYLEDNGIPQAWGAALADGHEVANHTKNHPNGRADAYDLAAWNEQVSLCTSELSEGLGLDVASIVGFRTPYLGYNDATFAALVAQNLAYDSTIGTCWAAGEDGRNCSFPYTLDNGSPDNTALVAKFDEPLVGDYPGLWEVPVSTLILPPDSLAAQYGFEPGLRGRIPTDMTSPSYYEPATGKIAALDVTLYVDAHMKPDEVRAALEYNFDLHFNGNRAPFVFVAHTHVYVSSYDSNAAGTADERRAAIEDFLAYALAKTETRVRPLRDVVEWMRHPKTLTGAGPQPVVPGTGGSSNGSGGSSPGSGGSSEPLGGAGGQGPSDSDDGSEAGCSCRTAPARSAGALGPWALVGLGLALGLRRRLGRAAPRALELNA